MRAAVLLPLVLLLSSCASTQPSTTVMPVPQTTLVQGGTVTDVRDVTVHGRHSTGLGSVVGSILGGIAGSTIGSGNGSVAASIGGAVAGGIAGKYLEQAGSVRRSIEVTVKLDNGEQRTYSVEAIETFRVGDAVRVTTTNGISRLSH